MCMISMTDALNRLLNFINDSSASDSESEPDIETTIANIAALDVPAAVVAPPAQVKIYEYDSDYNILDPLIRDEFKNEIIYNETEIFTAPVSTTNTMEGFMSNVSIHEQVIIEEIEPDDCIVVIRCNYGKLVYPGYVEPVKIKKTNRGRKKRTKQKKPRKKQGFGTDFSSQITFMGISPENPDKVYKFKIFRTGVLQLPGAQQDRIDDVVYCAKHIATLLNNCLHPNEQNPAKLTHVVNINPVMKNYKFRIKMGKNNVIDMEMLKEILALEWLAQLRGAAAPDGLKKILGDVECERRRDDYPSETPRIFLVKYTQQETKLSVIFDTPIKNNANKKTRVNIFMRGKVNILGAFYAESTRNIIDYIHDIFLSNDLIVEEYIPPTTLEWTQNVADPPPNSPSWLKWHRPIPMITDDDLDSIIAVAADEVEAKSAAALEYIASLGD